MWQKIERNRNFKQKFNVFLVIFEAWQGYELKAYGVSNCNLKLQSKKFSRTRDIHNFSTQGWTDTAFYMRNWSETCNISTGSFQHKEPENQYYIYDIKKLLDQTEELQIGGPESQLSGCFRLFATKLWQVAGTYESWPKLPWWQYSCTMTFLYSEY